MFFTVCRVSNGCVLCVSVWLLVCCVSSINLHDRDNRLHTQVSLSPGKKAAEKNAIRAGQTAAVSNCRSSTVQNCAELCVCYALYLDATMPPKPSVQVQLDQKVATQPRFSLMTSLVVGCAVVMVATRWKA